MPSSDRNGGPGPRARRAPGRRLARGLEVRVGDARGRAVDDQGLGAWLASIAPAPAAGREVSVALVGDGFMRRLNRRYRGSPHATDVLSFGVDGAASPLGVGGLSGSDPVEVPRPLGDIVIATGVAARQASRLGHSFAIELRVLALHGLLHLLGYDHDRDAGEMARVERRLRRLGGLSAGLVERTSRA